MTSRDATVRTRQVKTTEFARVRSGDDKKHIFHSLRVRKCQTSSDDAQEKPRKNAINNAAKRTLGKSGRRSSKQGSAGDRAQRTRHVVRRLCASGMGRARAPRSRNGQRIGTPLFHENRSRQNRGERPITALTAAMASSKATTTGLRTKSPAEFFSEYVFRNFPLERLSSSFLSDFELLISPTAVTGTSGSSD
jgi:hypothetical protein